VREEKGRKQATVRMIHVLTSTSTLARFDNKHLAVAEVGIRAAIKISSVKSILIEDQHLLTVLKYSIKI